MSKVAILTIDPKTGAVKGKLVEGSHAPHIVKDGCYIVLGVEEVKKPKKEKTEEESGTPQY